MAAVQPKTQSPKLLGFPTLLLFRNLQLPEPIVPYNPKLFSLPGVLSDTEFVHSKDHTVQSLPLAELIPPDLSRPNIVPGMPIDFSPVTLI